MSHPGHNVRMVLAGHIHRNGIYTVSEESAAEGNARAGGWRVWLQSPVRTR